MAQGIRKYKPFLIIEEGKQKYTKEQLKEAGLDMETIPDDNNIPNRLAVLPPMRDKRADVTFYMMGSDNFIDHASDAAIRRGFRGKISRKFANEDELMENLGLSFPAHQGEEGQDGDGKATPFLTGELQKIEDPDIPLEELSAVILAAEELKGYQISPATPENIFHTLVEQTKPYLHDKSRAENTVRAFLQKKSK